MLLFVAYPLIAFRIYCYGRQRGWGAQDSLLYAGSCVVGKFPNLAGQMKFHWNRLRGQRNQLIEYK
ncbi:MAG: hypothetical protein HC781_07640 [Leptolyngbyaceae cyanobacterium CSU_1_4]|nr:hypothetical protein [Leptolyngbyaceae cyanobacterium CSU_1_4]